MAVTPETPKARCSTAMTASPSAKSETLPGECPGVWITARRAPPATRPVREQLDGFWRSARSYEETCGSYRLNISDVVTPQSSGRGQPWGFGLSQPPRGRRAITPECREPLFGTSDAGLAGASFRSGVPHGPSWTVPAAAALRRWGSRDRTGSDRPRASHRLFRLIIWKDLDPKDLWAYSAIMRNVFPEESGNRRRALLARLLPPPSHARDQSEVGQLLVIFEPEDNISYS